MRRRSDLGASSSDRRRQGRGGFGWHSQRRQSRRKRRELGQGARLLRGVGEGLPQELPGQNRPGANRQFRKDRQRPGPRSRRKILPRDAQTRRGSSEKVMSNEKKAHLSESSAVHQSSVIIPDPSLVISRQANPQIIELIAKHKVEGLRLDQYLAGMFSDHSRSVIQKVIEADGVQVNGKPGKASYRIRYGDQVRITLPPPMHDLPVPEDIPLDVLYEDEFLALVNKPPDMVVHPAKGHWSGTLVNALQFRFPQLSQAGGEYRPGIVHRLDRDTSGVILIAKEEQSHRDLGLQFETRKIFKEYQAITAGVLDRDSDYIERRIAKHVHERKKMMVTDEEEDSKEACSYYEVIERFRGFTFCRIQPRTGRTHQIRVHLASIGCPVLADKTYGGRDCFRLSELVPELPLEAEEVLMPRQALHASRLRFTHPRLQRFIEAEAPLPPEFQKALAALRKYRPFKS